MIFKWLFYLKYVKPFEEDLTSEDFDDFKKGLSLSEKESFLFFLRAFLLPFDKRKMSDVVNMLYKQTEESLQKGLEEKKKRKDQL